jgi:hypothetical protein
VRVKGKPRQKVVAYLGRLDELREEGAIDALVEGLAQYAQQARVLDVARDLFVHAAKEYGPVLVFKRLWEELGLGELLARYVGARGYEFDVVAAVFAMVLNRLLSPCSKLGVSRWIEEVEEPSFAGLELHHFYRALDVLWEHKERLEEDLFRKRRDLFSRFQGEGPAGLAEYGHSPGQTSGSETDRGGGGDDRGRGAHRPRGLPRGHRGRAELRPSGHLVEGAVPRWAGDRGVGRGTVSEGNLELLSELGLSYIVGMRMRRVREVGEEMVGKLVERLARGGLKGLMGNRGYRRYLRIEGAKVEIDEGALKREARYDGKYVLLTDGDLPAEEVALAYKGLWRAGAAFREPEVPLRVTRHGFWGRSTTGPRARAHVAVCFLALLLEVELERRLRERGWGRASRRCFRTLCG